MFQLIGLSFSSVTLADKLKYKTDVFLRETWRDGLCKCEKVIISLQYLHIGVDQANR
jgi:hypothetical protein